MRPPLNVQLSITSSSKLQISIVISFWRATTKIQTPSKSQSTTKSTTIVMAGRTSAFSMEDLGFSQISNTHNFCYTTPNPTCEIISESSRLKEQPPKISIPKDECSTSYNKSKICLKPSQHTSQTHMSLITRDFSFLHFFPMTKVKRGKFAHTSI